MGETHMTDEEWAAADAAYDALPGTTPDGWSFIDVAELGDDGRDVVVERIMAWQPEMTFFRVTDLTGKNAKPPYPEGVYIECWKTEPRKQAEFNPPLTLTTPTPVTTTDGEGGAL